MITLHKTLLAIFFLAPICVAIPSDKVHRENYGHAELQGKRPTMEDAHNVLISDKYALYGLYDGHGGKKVSEYLADHLNKTINAQISLLKNPADALINGYHLIHNILNPQWASHQGSTAITALIHNNKLYIANVGDSRAVLYSRGKVVALSQDHKPDRPDERKRIEDAGGIVIWNGCWRTQGVLALSRAMGDKELAPYVSAEPEITIHTLSSRDRFLILACDGVWDVLSNKQAARIVRASLAKDKDAPKAARALVNAAYNAGSTDNISALVIQLP